MDIDADLKTKAPAKKNDEESKGSEANTKLLTADELTQTMNGLIRKSSKQIADFEEQQEKALRATSKVHMRKIDYLNSSFDEDWLRENFLPNRFRC